MSTRKTKFKPRAKAPKPHSPELSNKGLGEIYCRARELAAQGDRVEARRHYGVIGQGGGDPPFNALLHNDLAVLDALGGDYESALRRLDQALLLDPNCKPARDNLALLQQDLPAARPRPPAALEKPALSPSLP